ncbi:hypothetical protein PTT_09404 [Paecilomyces variotii No. 5]|uniref:SET domain-containing protein n=1 Tax=Byssochlamys spectabilis (strain No. 5 / NBRC 109023) TaxID=1356009 RepID=V5G5R6_BYSSN|nr:hypothetical protein PTT_09404 [Paecilomyces variotii No. 5]
MVHIGKYSIWLVFSAFGASSSILSDKCASKPIILEANPECLEISDVDATPPINEQGPVNSIPQNGPSTTTGTVGKWSYKPYCTDLISDIQSKLCVYTDHSFAQNRGISIFTTPQIADEFSQLRPLQDPSVLAGINNPRGPWYPENLPGRGIGLLAKNNINSGERLMAYTPLLIMHQHHQMPIPLREKFLRLAIDQLPEASKKQYLRLATIYGNSSVIVQDVIQTNAFEIQVGGQMHLAVFPEASRMNHDCAPNAQYFLDPLRITQYVHAARSISKGEELTIAYSTPLDFVSNRQKHLKKSFRFTCRCSRCLTGQAADTALAEIKSIESSLADWTKTSTASTKLAERLIRLYRQERLDGFLDTAFGYAALTYNAIGNSVQAKKYAHLAAESGAMKDGPDGANR